LKRSSSRLGEGKNFQSRTKFAYPGWSSRNLDEDLVRLSPVKGFHVKDRMDSGLSDEISFSENGELVELKFKQKSATETDVLFTYDSKEMADRFQSLKEETLLKLKSASSQGQLFLDAEMNDRIEKQTRTSLVTRIMQESTKKVVEKFKIKPVSPILFKFDPWDGKHDFEFTAQIEMAPKIKAIKVPALKFREEKAEISNSMIDRAIANMIRMHIVPEKVEKIRRLKKGDLAILEIEAFEGDKRSAEASAKGFQLEIQDIKKQSFLEKQVVGMKQQESKTFDYKYENSFPNPLLAGKTIKFKVLVSEIRKLIVPKLDENFVRKIFVPYESGRSQSPHLPKSVADLRAFVKKELEFVDQSRKFEQKKEIIIGRIVSQNPIEIPKTLRANQKNSLISFERERLKAAGQTLDIESEIQKRDAEFDATAEKMVRSALIVDFLAKRNNIDCTDHDIEKFVAEKCRTTGEDKTKVLQLAQNHTFKNQLKFAVLEQKVTQVVLDKMENKKSA